MPAGISWGPYLRYMCAAMLSMMAGAQIVHSYYHPLADLDELVHKEKEVLLKERRTALNVQGTVKLPMTDGHENAVT